MQERKISPWLIAFRVIFTIAVGGCIAFIFSNSFQIGADSSLRSQEAMRIINAILDKVHLGPWSEHFIRKLAHFSEFCLEGFLLTLCLRVYTARFVRHISWPLLGGLLTALLDETIQLFIPGRTSQVRDVWIDFAGVTAGMCVALVLLLILRAFSTLWTVKRENKRLRSERDAYRKRAGEYERDAEKLEQIKHRDDRPTRREDIL